MYVRIEIVIVISDMTNIQKRVVKTYNSAVCIMFGVVVVYYVLFKVSKLTKRFFCGRVQEVGSPSGIMFR